MSRMEKKFAEMMANNEKILVSYFPLGDSIVSDAVDWAGKFLDNGTTVLEFGLPYENPIMDGPVVAESMARALQRTDLSGAFEDLRNIRKAYPDAILQIMTYVENILKYGFEEFASLCAEMDVDAVLAPNADGNQMEELDRTLSARGIDNLRFVPYHLTDKIVKDLQKHASGYVYLQAVDGQTGSNASITDQAGKNAEALRKAGITVPLIPGFGISTPEHVHTYLSMGLDGVIVGSAIIRKILEGTGEEYIKSLGDACR